MPSVPVFLSPGTDTSTERTPLLQSRSSKPNRKLRRTRTVSSPPLGFHTPLEGCDPPFGASQRLQRVPTAASLTTIHEADENEDFESSLAIINTPRSGSLARWTYFSLGSYGGRVLSPKRKALLWTTLLLSGVFVTSVFVSLPLYLQTSFDVGSDAYVAMVAGAIWFPVGLLALLFITKYFVRSVPVLPDVGLGSLLLSGMLLGISHLGFAIACLPSRTPPAFQSMQLTLAFPVWRGTQAVLERKCPRKTKLGGIILSLMAVAFTMVPELLLATHIIGAPRKFNNDRVTGSWIGICILACTSIVFGVYLGLVERISRRPRNDLLTTVAWTHVISLPTLLLFFWVEFLHDSVAVRRRSELARHFDRGFSCLYNWSRFACANMAGKGALFICSYILGVYILCLLVRSSRGASSYSYMTSGLIAAMSTVCWTLFAPLPTFHFSPVITPFTACLLTGVVLFLLAMVFFTMPSSNRRHSRLPSRTPTFVPFRYELPIDNEQQRKSLSKTSSSSLPLSSSSSSGKQGQAGMRRIKSTPAMLGF